MSAGSLLMIGLILGLAGALYYAWIAEPVTFTEASPARLRESYKQEYILLVSQSFEAGGNWELAQERLVALGETDTGQVIVEQLEVNLRNGHPSSELHSLAVLARQVGVDSPVVDVFAPPPTPALSTLATPATTPVASALEPSPVFEGTRLPTSTPAPSPTPTPVPSPTQVPAYRLLSQVQVCDPTGPAERIEVITVDSFLEPLSGTEGLVSWEGGRDHFFTGYKPELGLGYGDVNINPDTSYDIMMADGSQVVSNLRIELCDPIAGGHPGGWRLTFQNTDVVQESP
jgi:hypothetical protein